MAGCDYAGLAVCPSTKQWTNMGYVKHSKGLFGFHKGLDSGAEVLLEPGGVAFNQTPGIAKINLDGNDWYLVYGYSDQDNIDFAIKYFEKQVPRVAEIFKKIASGKLNNMRVV
ncbi:MAG: hypothetical protein JRZ94_05505 [Nitrososphaerota archaeon]|nr:hypothetical protein [Nitrososphaerota archaeon]